MLWLKSNGYLINSILLINLFIWHSYSVSGDSILSRVNK